MAQHDFTLQHAHGSLSSYITGFVLSIILTITPFTIIINKWMNGWVLLWFLVAFAVMQLLVQLVFFLHIGQESKPRWNLVAIVFMIIFLLIVVAVVDCAKRYRRIDWAYLDPTK